MNDLFDDPILIKLMKLGFTSGWNLRGEVGIDETATADVDAVFEAYWEATKEANEERAEASTTG